MIKKKILYLDMDGVVADFNKAIIDCCPGLLTSEMYKDEKARSSKVDEICSCDPEFFQNLEPIEGAIEAVNELFDLFDVYFLSTPMWKVPASFSGKRIWVEKHFGDKAVKRLILTHRKDLNRGDFLVDDRIMHGVDEFQGLHIHFGTDRFPNWQVTLDFLRENV